MQIFQNNLFIEKHLILLWQFFNLKGTVINPNYHLARGSYLGSSIVGSGVAHHSIVEENDIACSNGSFNNNKKIRRPPLEYECTPPRILSRLDPDEQQYYYG